MSVPEESVRKFREQMVRNLRSLVDEKIVTADTTIAGAIAALTPKEAKGIVGAIINQFERIRDRLEEIKRDVNQSIDVPDAIKDVIKQGIRDADNNLKEAIIDIRSLLEE